MAGEFLAGARPQAVGVDQRPLGPARFEFVTGEDFYTAALDSRIKALVGFGGNMVMAHADSLRGREALRSLDFLRPGRPLHDPDRGTRRHRAAGHDAV